MPHHLARYIVAACILAIAACSAPKPPTDVEAAARLSFQQLRAGEDAALLARSTPQISDTDPAVFGQMRAALPAGEPSSSKAAVWRVTIGTAGHRASVEHVYEYGDQAVVVGSALYRPTGDEPWQVEGLHVTAVSEEQAAAAKFTLSGKSAAHYAFLAAAIGTLVLMIGALVAVIRTRGLKRKWLWGLLAFAGLFSFQMNWGTGEVIAQWLSVQLIGLGVTKNLSPLAPWIIKFTLPVGALLVLARVAKARRETRTAPSGS